MVFVTGEGMEKSTLASCHRLEMVQVAWCDANTCHFLSSYLVQAAIGSPLKNLPTPHCALFAVEIKHGSSLNWEKTGFAHSKFC